MGRYIKVALGLLAWMLLGALIAGCGDKTTHALGEGPTPVAQAAIDLRPNPGATRARPTPTKGSALRESSTQARVGARPAAPRRAGGPGKPPSRATKQWVRPRTVDVLVWPRLREVRISSPALRDARFRARLVRLLEEARAGGSPVGASIYLRLSPRRPDPAPALDLITHQIKAHLGKDVKVRLVLVDRRGKPLPVGCGCPLPPTN
ncbi:hypothetical protein Tter_2082 [Thermobaculum terrenum ATCC BAA-798]|uniref:Uncharacterized protein n=1 Tax=Thermobaculum terrenum (strain ATCC BAA-798 / CCMEE 7001 / YNP1) TaxID=525904 RepID=D1CGW4_THET1|nr:hypothetical protein [Thermobaculum terrenum]ACZ42985.1 hypothetical protein Tter_2082 [Thermobaculum terrenum ATCC BAA-798]